MQSKIIKLFDYRTAEIPHEMTLWRVTQDEIDRQLRAVALRHAEQITVDTVQAGDGVCCEQAGDAVLPGREAVLLYPGRNLPGAEEAEKAVLGRKPGETFQTVIKDKALTLRVREITRSRLPEIDDRLIQKEKLEGVDTLEDYIRWYRSREEKERRENACQEIAFYWLRLMAAKSDAEIVEEERRAYMAESARYWFDVMVSNGEDPCVPEDGTEFLTEEQALEKLGESYKDSFLMGAVYELVAKERGVTITDEAMEKEYRTMAEFSHITVEQCQKELPPDKLRESMYMEAVAELLGREAETFLEV